MDGESVRLGVLDRLDDWRDSSTEPRGAGERGRGLLIDMGAVAGTFGKEKDRSDVGVELSTAAVLVAGV